MQQLDDLSGTFLVATPSLTDPFFDRSVAYVIEHNEDGAMAFLINKPTNLTVSELMTHLDPKKEAFVDNAEYVLMGGPVANKQVFVVVQDEPISSDTLETPDTQALLQRLANNQISGRYTVFLGYAAWGAEQLEEEILDNDWLIVPTEDLNLMFNVPINQRWHTALSSLGITAERLSSLTGKA